jgi:competence protein ComEC
MIGVDELSIYSFQVFYEPYSSLLNGFVLGLPVSKTFSSYDAVHRAGLVHLLVLSGGNLTILGRTVEVLTDGINKRLQLVLVLLALTFFCLIVGFKAPLLRAYAMSVCTIVALSLGRPMAGLFALFLSGLAILWIDQTIFASVSFQLSYAATLGIICFTPLIETYMDRLPIGRFLRTELSTSLGGQLLTIPIVAYYFHEVSFVGLLANILVATVVPFIFIGGLLFYLSSAWVPMIGQLVSYFLLPLLWYFLFIARIVSSIPYGWYKW